MSSKDSGEVPIFPIIVADIAGAPKQRTKRPQYKLTGAGDLLSDFPGEVNTRRRAASCPPLARSKSQIPYESDELFFRHDLVPPGDSDELDALNNFVDPCFVLQQVLDEVAQEDRLNFVCALVFRDCFVASP